MSKRLDRVRQAWSSFFQYSRVNRLRVVGTAASMAGIIAFIDLVIVRAFALGYLYIIPVIVAAGFLSRWQILAMSFLFALLRELGSPTAWSGDYLAHIALVGCAFAGAGLFVKELVRNQRYAFERVEEMKARQQLERQLLHAQRLEAVGRLAGGIAHDFNNLLSVIIGFGDLALHQLETDTPARRDVQEIRKAADRAAALTRQLLEFSRRDVLQPKVIEVNTLVSNLSNMLRRLIGEDVTLDLALQPQVSHVRADAGSIEQVVMNLVVNARDAMPHGGTLTIETGEVDFRTPSPSYPPGLRPGRYVTLAVRDTGVGMDRGVQEHLFEPFFTTKEVGKGTGLGLSTVYGIVKQNGGEIWFVSEKERGTTFTIYLPPTEAVAEPGNSTQPPLDRRRKPATVLLVEDDVQVRQLAREILTRNGLTVIEARNPAEVMNLCQRPGFCFDLLLTDVVMPGMSGPELAQKLSENWPSTNVLFMTGYADESLMANHCDRSTVPLIKKPLSEQSLIQGVRAVLGQQPVSRSSRAGGCQCSSS